MTLKQGRDTEHPSVCMSMQISSCGSGGRLARRKGWWFNPWLKYP